MASLRIFLLLTFLAFVAAQESNPIVRLSHGLLRGSWKVSAKGRTYASFEGVPYARPPVSKYRFKEPQQLQPWSDTWNATKPQSDCLQYVPFSKTITGAEDCLYLNVHTPKLNAEASLPVVVYIHGGAFLYGTGTKNKPDYFMDKDLVVVTVNYRLGPLGFLSTGDDAAPGNAGLKDQAFALHWIQNNIVVFGGDPDSVTLTGGSAGAASVHYHYLSPLSRGTFARGIAFSGSAFASWTHAVKPVQKAMMLATIVGCPTTTTREMIDCLRTSPADVVVKAQIEMFDWKVHLFTPFTPTIEAPSVKEPFLSQYPWHATQAGQMQKLPLITSVTSEEGLYPAAVYLSSPELLPELEAKWEQLASNIFEYNDTLPVNLRPAVAAKIRQQYFANQPLSQKTFPQLIRALGDRLFAADVGKLAQLHALNSGQPTYLYRYSFRGEWSLSSAFAHTDENFGVSHADDVFHMFKIQGFEVNSTQDKKMTEDLIDMIYSFSTTGAPKLTNDGPEWFPVTPGSAELNYLDIHSPTDFEMKSSSDFGQKSFWDSLGFIENDKYNATIRDAL